MFGVNLNEQLVNIVEFNFTKIDKALAFGGTMLVIGVGTVFAVLSLLWISPFFPTIKSKQPCVTLSPMHTITTGRSPRAFSFRRANRPIHFIMSVAPCFLYYRLL